MVRDREDEDHPKKKISDIEKEIEKKELSTIEISES